MQNDCGAEEYEAFGIFRREILPVHPMKAILVGLFAALVMVAVGFAAISIRYQERPLPEESAAKVVEKFYEYISEAKIRGGTMLINEAYKMTSGARSRTAQAKFLEVINRYPSGFKVEVVESKVKERHAVVLIEYQLASSFGGSITMRDPVHLNVDDESNTWKVDFRGDTDDQDRGAIAKTIQLENSSVGLGAVTDAGTNKGESQ